MASFFASMFMVYLMIFPVNGVHMIINGEGKILSQQNRPLAMDIDGQGVVTPALIEEGSGSVGRAGKGETTITMEYGGTSHGNSPHNGNVLARPEAVRSQNCNTGVCQDCTKRELCWHGVEVSGWGYMAITVAAGSSFTHYIAEVWAKCSSTVGTWYFKVYDLVNGEVVLTENGVEKHKTSTKDKHYLNLGLPSTSQARMRVSFAHTDQSKAANCRFYLEAFSVDPSVDTCMSAKECLSQLGDETDAAYELRNGNSNQMKCLKGDRSAFSDALKAKCEAWDGCVDGTGKKKRLVALLKAASKTTSSLITGLITENKTLDATNCVHPAVDDPESWDCECADDMFNTCNEDASDVEDCLNKLMCANSNVCGSWKQDHCESSSSSLMAQRSIKNDINAATEVTRLPNLGGLDDTLSGKCAEQ